MSMTKASEITVQFQGYDLGISLGKYQHDKSRTSLRLFDKSDGMDYISASVNLPEEPLEAQEIIIKNYSENEGVYQALRNAQVIGRFKREARVSGCYVCDLLVEP